MTTAVAPQLAATADPRERAFCDRRSAEVFHAVANGPEIWRADPFDVDDIHAAERALFRRLLVRAAEAKSPLAGKVLLLHGVAGSGKTHLLRAFRTLAHRDGLGYCGYMPMTTEVGNYARYALQNLIDRLEERYDPDPDGGDRTGLARLAAGVLDAVPGLTAEEKMAFRQEDPADPATVVEAYADRLAALTEYKPCDLELLRVLLHLQRPEPKVRNRALMWLRCQEMTAPDRAVLGDIVPRAQEEDAQRMLAQLARVAAAVHGAPLVLLIDQLEDMENLSLPAERFRKLVDVVTALTDQVPTAVVVIACLEDYYKQRREGIGGGKQYRLEHDPEAVRLVTQRTPAEIRAMVAKRLGVLFAEAGLDVPEGEIGPFADAHLAPLAILPTRLVLDNLRRHHLRCIQAEKWIPPAFDGTVPKPDPEPNPEPGFARLWNDFLAAFTAPVPDEDEGLARVLTDAIRSCGEELPEGMHFGVPEPDPKQPNLIEVDVHTHDGSTPLLVAVCNKKAQGSGLAGQVAAVAARAAGFGPADTPVALARTTPFPGKAAQVTQQIAKLLKQDGRRVVVENAEWRRMLAFESFRAVHVEAPGFRAWQRAEKPLGELRALQDILRLKSLVATKPAAAAPVPPTPPTPPTVPPSPPAPKVTTVAPPATKAGGAEPAVGPLHLGQTTGVTPRVVELTTDSLATHAAFIGSTKSGKTTAALALIEQLLLRGVPAVLLDRKGDLARYADPAAWVAAPLDAARTAERDRLRAVVDVRLFTPGCSDGRPLGLPVVPPGFAELSEADREQFARYAATALGSMLGFKTSDSDRQQQAVLAQAIQVLAEVPGAAVTVPALRDLVKDQDDALVTRVGGFKAAVYDKLADRLLTLWLNNRQLFADGESLDVDALLGTGAHAQPGRTRLSVVSTKFLAGADQVDFWVTQFLVAVGRWCAKSPSDRLQAVFFFDEADQYLPAQRQPATKGPMTDLLKRARSAGVGVMLATQNPGDFDYKCRENVLTWLVGRVTEPRSIEKLRPVLSAAKGDAPGKLAGQKAGEFHVATEKEVTAVRVAPSLVKTEQLPEDRIATLARANGK